MTKVAGMGSIHELLPWNAGKSCRTKRGRLDHVRAFDRNTEHIGLKLHQPRIGRRSAVNPQAFEAGPAAFAHHAEYVGRAVRHGLERRARKMRPGASAREPDNRASRIRLPVRRPEPDERGNKVDALVGRERRGKRAGLACGLDDAESIAQPLHRRAGDENRGFIGVRRLAVGVACHGHEQSFPSLRATRPGIQQKERARTIRVLPFSGLPAPLPEQRGLLVSGHAEDRNGRTEHLGRRRAEIARGGAYLWEHGHGDAEELAQLRTPGVRADVVQQRAGRISVIGRVHLAAGESPQEPGVDRPRAQFTGGGAVNRKESRKMQPT